MKLIHAANLLLLGIGLTSPALADPAGTEPLNDKLPLYPNGPAEVIFESYTNGFVMGHEISTTTDNDYLVIACPTPGELLHSAVIRFSHATGDLDMAVWSMRTDGKADFVSSSTGVTDTEEVQLLGTKLSTAVVQVYGYRGARSWYWVTFYCTPQV